jgi:hypothetical protein
MIAVVRFAPSATGPRHVGNIRAAPELDDASRKTLEGDGERPARAGRCPIR